MKDYLILFSQNLLTLQIHLPNYLNTLYLQYLQNLSKVLTVLDVIKDSNINLALNLLEIVLNKKILLKNLY